MKKYFAKTNGFECVLFVDENGKAFVVDENNFDERLTVEVAKNADYSNFEDCETAEECAQAIGTSEAFESVIDFNADEYEELVEF